MIQDEPASNLYFTGSAVVHGSVQITGSSIFLPLYIIIMIACMRVIIMSKISAAGLEIRR